MIDAKEGKLLCPDLLKWVRGKDCKACVEQIIKTGNGYLRLPSEAHHFPPKGMGGATHRDDHVMPLCREHHDQAQRYVIPRETQERWVLETRSAFLEESTVEELRAYFDALEVWKDRPLACPF